MRTLVIRGVAGLTVLVAVAAVLAGAGAVTIAHADDPVPACKYLRADFPRTALNVIKPAPYVPSNLAQYSGVWEGQWVNPALPAPAPSVISIWGVSDRQAIAVYQFPPSTLFPQFLMVQPDGSLRAQSAFGGFWWSLRDGGTTLHGEFGTGSVDMRRCQPPAG